MFRLRYFFASSILVLLLFSSCRSREGKDTTEYTFTDSLMLRYTSVRSQEQWPVGWIYATLGMVESDRIKVSDSLELSATYLIRRCAEQALAAQGSGKGKMNAAQAFEGTPYACLDLMKQSGIVTYASYHRRPATNYVRFWENLTQGDARTVLDTTFAYLPPYVSLYGALYTPVDLARSLYIEDAYEAFVAVPFLPRGTHRMALRGDVRKALYTNVRPDDFVQIADTTLRHGYTLVWMGDTTAVYYSSTRGIAVCEEPDGGSEAWRRDALYGHRARPYHCLQIVGIAYGKARGLGGLLQKKKRFFVCRGSQGARGPYRGLVYLSENYLKKATAALYRHKITLRRFE